MALRSCTRNWQRTIPKHGPPGVTLDLSFMTGTLPTGVTLTRASTATYFDSTGTMRTAAANVARFDYNPSTRALNGLLIEEARTNGITDSANIGAGTWSNIATTTGALVVAPDGTTTGTTLIGSAGNARTLHQSSPAVGTNTITISVWLKAAAPVTARIGLGSVSIREIVTQSVSVTTAWQRFSVTTTGLASDTGNAQLSVYCSDGTNGNTINAWGAQLEVGPFPTSYIPTTSAAVTRAQDSCTIPSANMSWFTPPGGSWATEFITFSPTPNAASSRIIGNPSGNSIGPVFLMAGSPVNGFAQYDGAVVSTAIAASINVVNKGATTWASGNAQACLNGGAIAASSGLTTGYASLASSGIRICSSAITPADGMTGYIRRVRYWPRVLSNTELQQVTT